MQTVSRQTRSSPELMRQLVLRTSPHLHQQMPALPLLGSERAQGFGLRSTHPVILKIKADRNPPKTNKTRTLSHAKSKVVFYLFSFARFLERILEDSRKHCVVIVVMVRFV